MCGIVGYSGYRDASDVLVSGLTRLEYRGYDSAGIAVFEKDGNVTQVKAKGELKNLKNKLSDEYKPVGITGIGHTRWATHGEPSDLNSHPHRGRRVTIVHNGIIENYAELKAFLTDNGYEFFTATDTEVAANLLDYYYKGDPLRCITDFMSEVVGSFALGIMFDDIKDTIYAVRKESPLIVGVGDNEAFIASDVTAILEYTKKYYLLEHNEIAKLTANSVEFYNHRLKRFEKELKIADWDLNAAEKGGYPHYMIKEIHEQPTAVKTTITPRIKNGLPDLSECGITAEKLQTYRRIFIVACGTAMYAGMVGKYLIEGLARVPVEVDVASEFRYRNPIIGKGDLVIIISQSGETADSLEALKISKSLGAETLGIVNVKGSSIARNSDMLIYTHAGPEIAVASTKAYMVQLSVMYLFAFKLALAKGAISIEECERLTKGLAATPELIQNSIDTVINDCQFVATKLVAADDLFYLGRGLDYALSLEGSLKLKEITYIHSESYASGELKHGPISLICEGMPVIAIATQKSLIPKTVSNVEEVKARGAMTILVCDEETVFGEETQKALDYIIKVPKTDEVLMPMSAIVPLQLLAYYTSVNKGIDMDKPRNLAKSVTVE
ncbi:MAG: glutamine--fructose-6-phosphate transaminase (isomerizing) [Oscillospiraceae bacterium]|jgi:glucosamine--fructose-6-phosphate aminotransferase (isomerizing)|nr:glutamine--fructose-6-phosphate transaminase (isomerizing) [Oscillospiraceae bacterium]